MKEAIRRRMIGENPCVLALELLGASADEQEVFFEGVAFGNVVLEQLRVHAFRVGVRNLRR